MKAQYLKTVGSWRDVADAANETIGRDAGMSEPSSNWKRRMLLAEHSPIRSIQVVGRWEGIKYWVSVHLTRHWLGIVHWVQSQRTDRTGIDRDCMTQDAPVNHRFQANAQALINISRKRMCNLASDETREAWIEMVAEISLHQPEIASACVPDCVYRGHCYEYRSCGFHRTEKYRKWLETYRDGINP